MSGGHLSDSVDLADAHAPKRVDLSRAGQSLWLVKVPKYLDELWRRAQPNQEVGYLVTDSQGGSSESKGVSLRPAESVVALADQPNLIPRDHSFIISQARPLQTQAVLQEEFVKNPQKPDVVESRMSIFGTVRRRIECRPQDPVAYMKLKKYQLERSRSGQFKAEQLQKQVQARKPIAYHSGVEKWKKERKEEGKKLRGTKEEVRAKLFSAFEKHQYYNVKDLVEITNQPLPFLKEVLKEIAVHNVQGPHKNMWELKPEYRHYKSVDASAMDDDDDDRDDLLEAV